MLHYRTREEKIDLQIGTADRLQVSKMICLENYKVWILLQSGKYQVWNIQQLSKVQEGEISAASKNHTLLSPSQIAYIDISDSRLRVLDLTSNELSSKVNMELPTMTARGGEPKKTQIMVEENTQLISLPQSNLLIVCEQRGAKGQYEYVITVVQQEIFPAFFSQFIYTSLQPCLVKALNKKDSIILWPNLVENAQMSFLVWNVLNKEKGCLSLSFKEPFSGCAVDATSWGSGKIAFWINGSTFSKPEMKILNTKDGQEFKGLIDCYSEPSNANNQGNNPITTHDVQGAWLLADVLHIDTEKNFALIHKVDETSNCLDIISLGKFKCTHTLSFDLNVLNTSFAFSQDSKYFLQYSLKPLASNSPLSMSVHTFEPFIAHPRARAFFLLDKSNITNSYGEEIVKKIVNMIAPKNLIGNLNTGTHQN